MPELPEVQALVDFLRTRTDGLVVTGVELGSISVLKTFTPPPQALVGAPVDGVSRHGKFIDIDFRDTVTALGAKQRFIKPHCPWQNGKVERFNRTLQTEWAYRQPFTTNDARAEALAPWLKHYNTERNHHGIGGHPPISRCPSPT